MDEIESAVSVDKVWLKKAMTYLEYRNLLDNLFAAGKTTGENQSESMLNYAKLNLQRMRRLEKTIEIGAELNEILAKWDSLNESMELIALTEGWCGDAAQNLPLIQKIAEANNSIELKVLLRDENLELMDQFLTNGGRSIPKVIALRSSDRKVLGSWGPRPEPAQKMLNEFKKEANGDYQNFQKELQLWYARDKTMTHQSEMTFLLKNWLEAIQA